MIRTLAVIPARYRSSRLPGKPLIKLCGKELVLWVWEGARQSLSVDRLIVATDCQEIADLIRQHGGEATVVTEKFSTGSDCVAHVSKNISSRFVLGIQVDDPLVTPAVIDPMIRALEDSCINLAVLAKQIEDPREIDSNSIVKVVFDEHRHALYFSRSPIPFSPNSLSVNSTTICFKHIGPYAWRRETLLEYYGAGVQRTPLEERESLEMLRVLEKGGVIHCLNTDVDTIEIDTPEDVTRFEEFMAKR
jgi:3-deoxy-manno-octulosonate cytidylyltransferase (CMP-KDO synthetase)